MTNISKRIIAKTNQNSLTPLFPAGSIVPPAYTGLSLLNLPGSLYHWLGLPPAPHPALQIPELDKLADDVDQVIMLLMDAVAFARMQQWLGSIPELQLRTNDGLFFPITSLSPSTTCNVLISLWTGRSPAEHAILGYELFLKEYGLVANMITHSPMAFNKQAGLLYQAGFDPENALPVPTIGSALKQGGVDVHTFINYNISESGLSLMQYQDTERHSFRSAADLWVAVRQLAEQPRKRRRLISIYHGAVDGLSHRYGPDSEQARAEFTTFIQNMLSVFMNPLSKAGRKKTLFLLTADHGQIHTEKDPKYELVNHPELTRILHLQPTGGSRLTYFHPRPGMVPAVEDYIHAAWPGEFSTMPSMRALETGLFGPGIPAVTVPDRIGDLLAIPTGKAYFWWADKPNPLLGRHGGLDPLEMLVPLLALRLD